MPETSLIRRYRPQPSRRCLRRAAPAFAAACAALAFSVAPATAATPCWKLLLNDWYDGAISNTYPIPCYQQAIDHLPTDVDVYSSAREDIQRALQQAIAAQRRTHTTVTKITPVTTHPATTAPTSTTTATTATTPTTTAVTTTVKKKKKKGPISTAIKDLTPGGADSFPLPLLILGFLAVLLVLAGLGGMAWRRYQGRGP